MSADCAPRDIGILMLAAGRGSRFGADKRVARTAAGATLLESSLARVPSSFTNRLLVLRPGDEALAARFAGDGWRICFSMDADRGMGHSLAAGISLAEHWNGALVALGDMPFVRPESYARLQQALCRHAIVVPVHDGRRGNPAGFRREFFGELSLLAGDRGARGLLERYADRVREIELGDAGVLRDVDTPAALDGEGAGL